ncbi:MAG: hypothetical protein CMJ58_16750 [Planctomycetaceae bacterium]|nr:hypothetical protein [Planctomycetaceae bacterium]
MQLGLVSGDLMLVARLEGAARQLGWKLVTAGSTAGAVAWSPEELAAVVVDLRTAGRGVEQFVADWQAAGHDAPIVACGPHVQEELLAIARNAGCAAVVTRGQIDREAEQILTAVTNQA